jgi:CRP-like cAMP-binding protein
MRKVLLFFGILDDSDVEWMMTTGAPVEVAPASVVIHEGKAINSIFLVIDGSFQVTVGEKEVAKLKPGEIVGEMSFVDSRPTSATVKALERSLVLSIPRQKLSERLGEEVAFAARFYRAMAVFLADRLRSSVAQLGYGKSGPTEQEIDERDELDPAVLENLTVASSRFDQMQRRVRAAQA